MQSVLGTRVEFYEKPFQQTLPFPLRFTDEESNAIDLEIDKFLKKEIISEVEHVPDEFISNIFTRKKSDGSLRVILNLNKLNEFVVYRHFKMDTLETALKMITKGCYMASVDLKDAYFSIPIHKKDRKYFRFIWKSKLFEFNAYPQGWGAAPRKFSKVLKPVYSTLRKMGHNSMGYIDDSFLEGKNYTLCKRNIKDTIELMIALGFVVHPVKSVIEPTHVLVFLGFIINSLLMIVTLTIKKIDYIQNQCRKLVSKSKCVIEELASVIGLIVASFPGVEYGRLHYRELEKQKCRALRFNYGNYKAEMYINRSIINELRWWIENLPFQKRDIVRKNPDVVLTSDASESGWGASVYRTSHKTGGRWNFFESGNHINYLELLGAFFALKCFLKDSKDLHVQILMDNMTGIAYINNMGGCKSPQCDTLAKEIWEWCINKNIWVSATFLPGKHNVVADRCSRHFNDNLEWKLDENVFERIINLWGNPSIDLFASRINAQLLNYVSWHPDPEAKFIDAFSISWSNKFVYIFPPFNLIFDVLQKIQIDLTEAILIIPMWTTQVWFSTILQLIIDYPRLLPKGCIYLPHSPEMMHSLQDTLQLVAMRVSGKAWKSSRFRNRLPALFYQAGDILQENNTPLILKNGKSFVTRGKLICFQKM